MMETILTLIKFKQDTSNLKGLVFIFFLVFNLFSFSQGNNCSTATPLVINGACASGNINDDIQDAPNLNGCARSWAFRREGWYTFTVTGGPTDVTITANATNRNLFLQLISSTAACTGLTQIACANDDNINNTNQTETITANLANGTYYVKVVNVAYGNSSMNLNSICITAPDPCTAPSAPTNLSFGAVTNNSIAGSFTGSGADNYLVLMNITGVAPTPPPTNGTSYNIGNTVSGATVIDNDNDTTFTASNLNPSTTYYFYVYAFNNDSCSGGPIYSVSSLDGNQITDLPSLCIPSSTFDAGDHIVNFSANGITTITNNNSGAGTTSIGYSDFTALSVTQVEGGNINFSVDLTNGWFDSYGVSIWVDWNNDLDFNDANETVYNNGGSITSATGSFTIPAGTVGSHIMRIRGDEDLTNPDPCGNIAYGEAEDYTLIVTELLCDESPSNIEVIVTSGTTATINWVEPLNIPANGYDYIISLDDSTFTPGDDITGSVTGNSINITGLTANTQYYAFVRSDCGATDGQGIWIPITFDTCSITITTPSACPLIVGEQGVNPFIADPFNADPSFLIGCDNPSITLEAHSQLQETTSYRAEKIEFEPPTTFVTFASTVVNLEEDDVWAETYSNIPFDFCFYGNTYNQCLVGANGNITFNPNITPGSASGYAFNNDLPSTVGALFEQTIYGVYHDIDPSASANNQIASQIASQILGTTVGCRKFVVSWYNIPMFSDNSILYTGMIVLHETTNIIEVFIQEKRIDNYNVSPWNGGNAIVGIQGDASVPESEVAPCRNGLDTNWDAINEAWRFVPDGAPINPSSITWYEGSGTGGTVVGNGSTLFRDSALGQGGTYTAEAVYNICGNNYTITDEVVVTQGTGKVWNGSTGSNDWANANNWTPAAVPTNTDCVLIPNLSTAPGPATNNYPVVYGNTDGDGLNLTIESGANLTLDNNLADANYATLTIVDFIDLEANSELIVNSSSSLIQVNESGANVNNNLGTGNLIVNRDTNIRQEDYVYWSSPVEMFSISNVYGANTPSYTYQWRQTIPNGFTLPPTIPICFGDWEAYSGNMSLGKGYISRGPIGHTATASIYTATFTGKPNNGIITQQILSGNNSDSNPNFTYNPYGTDLLTVTPYDDNWNLIGNPYPSALSADDFLMHPNNNIIEGAVHIWTHGSGIGTYSDSFYDDFVFNYNQNDYITYNLSGISNPNPTFSGDIGAGQGFFVLALNDNETGNVTFNNSMRSRNHDNSDFYRINPDGTTNRSTQDLERHRIWLNLLSENGQASSILVGYIEGATQEKDRLFDAFTFESNITRLYSLIEDERMVIQGRQLPFNIEDQVPLGVDIVLDGNYTITISDVDGLFGSETGQDIYLEDTYLGIIHDLRTSPYSFNIEEGSYEDRFILRYTNEALNVNQFEDNSDLTIYIENNLVKVRSEVSPIESIIVYNVLGQSLVKVNNIDNLNHVLHNLHPSDGILFVKATLINGLEKVQKIIY